MSKHTPGPWGFETYGKTGHFYLIGSDTTNNEVCRMATLDNARLIAAAPDLLAHLQFAVKLFRSIPALNATAQVVAMRAAIAKAAYHKADEMLKARGQ
jgi:hypothetical protein